MAGRITRVTFRNPYVLWGALGGVLEREKESPLPALPRKGSGESRGRESAGTRVSNKGFRRGEKKDDDY